MENFVQRGSGTIFVHNGVYAGGKNKKRRKLDLLKLVFAEKSQGRVAFRIQFKQMKSLTLVLIFLSLSLIMAQPTTTTTVRTCPFGNFLAPSGNCIECLSTCSRCQNLQAPCEGCAEGFKLSFNQNQCDACGFGQLRCDRNEISCQKRYRIENGECRPICLVSNCQYCTSILSTTCNGCYTNYKLSPNRTVCSQQTQLIIRSGRNLQQGGSTTAPTTIRSTTTETTTINGASASNLNDIFSRLNIPTTFNSQAGTGASDLQLIDSTALINTIGSGGSFNFGTSGSAGSGSSFGASGGSGSSFGASGAGGSGSSFGTSGGSGAGSGSASGTGAGSGSSFGIGTNFGTSGASGSGSASGTGSGTSFGTSGSTGTGSAAGTNFGTTGTTGTNFGTTNFGTTGLNPGTSTTSTTTTTRTISSGTGSATGTGGATSAGGIASGTGSSGASGASGASTGNFGTASTTGGNGASSSTTTTPSGQTVRTITSFISLGDDTTTTPTAPAATTTTTGTNFGTAGTNFGTTGTTGTNFGTTGTNFGTSGTTGTNFGTAGSSTTNFGTTGTNFGTTGTTGTNFGTTGTNFGTTGTTGTNFGTTGTNFGTTGTTGTNFGTTGTTGTNFGTTGTNFGNTGTNFGTTGTTGTAGTTGTNFGTTNFGTATTGTATNFGTTGTTGTNFGTAGTSGTSTTNFGTSGTPGTTGTTSTTTTTGQGNTAIINGLISRYPTLAGTKYLGSTDLTGSGFEGPFQLSTGQIFYVNNGVPLGIPTTSSTTTSTTTTPGATTTNTVTVISGSTSGTSGTTTPGPTLPIVTPTVTPPVVVPPIVTPTIPIVTPTIPTTPIINTNVQPVTNTSILTPGITLNNASTTTTGTTTTTTGTTTIPTPITPIPVIINHNCNINQYDDPITGCQRCSTKCGTCVNTADQCLECAQGRMKMGWKCVTNQNVAYNVSLSVPPGMEQYALTDGINQFKSNFINFLLPAAYAGTGLSAMTLTSTVWDSAKRVLNIGGVVDKIGGIGLADLNRTISNNIKSINTLGPFGIISSDIKAYPLDGQATTNNTATVVNGTTVSNITPTPAPENVNSPNLAAILVPSIIGGLLLLTLIPCLICYCCKCCCFKKKKEEELYTMRDTERPLPAAKAENTQRYVKNYQATNTQVVYNNPVPVVKAPVPPVEPVPVVAPRATRMLPMPQPLPIAAVVPPVTATTNEIITNINTNVNQAINRNLRLENQSDIKNSVNNVNIVRDTNTMTTNRTAEFNSISRKNEDLLNLNTNVSDTIRMTNQYIPPAEVNNTRYITTNNTTTNNLATFRNEQLATSKVVPVIGAATTQLIQTTTPMITSTTPLIQSTVGLGGARAVTTVTKQEKEEKEIFGGNGMRVVKDVRTIEETKPISFNARQDTLNVVSNVNNFAPSESKMYYYENGRRIARNTLEGQTYPVRTYTVQDQRSISPSRIVISNETISTPTQRLIQDQQRVITTETSRSLSPHSHKLIEAGGKSYIGNITKYSFKNGQQIVQKIQSVDMLPENEFSTHKSIQYQYLDSNAGKLLNPVRSEQELRNMGITNLAKNTEFYTTTVTTTNNVGAPGQSQWSYEKRS